jgi:hypothetical protein
MWATEALDKVRREVWNAARRRGQVQKARDLKSSRWALWKAGDRLNPKQQAKLDSIEETNQPLYRAYLLKEQLRLVFQLPFDEALDLLEAWLDWAENSSLPSFVDLAERIWEHLTPIANALDHRPSNAIVEGLNTRLRLITRRAFGFSFGRTPHRTGNAQSRSLHTHPPWSASVTPTKGCRSAATASQQSSESAGRSSSVPGSTARLPALCFLIGLDAGAGACLARGTPRCSRGRP